MGHLFTPESYDLEGTPKLNGRKASNIKVNLGSIDLDETDPIHMKLAGKLELGQPIALLITATPAKRDWDENTTEDGTAITCTYKLAVEDIATQ
jgi:hypothetical protein